MKARIYSAKVYSRLNLGLGIFAGLCAFIVYMLTLEPEVSFWDCPEYVVTGATLEIGHPPGNALFSFAARFFITLGGSMRHAAYAVNLMSALLSALTVMFMFWSLTMLLRYVTAGRDRIVTSAETILIFGASLAGAFVFAFCDTFWFSAVEAEVYAFSSFLTALCVWVMMRWAATDVSVGEDRLLVLTAYLLGLSIGVHQLNLLCIPALVLIFIYRRGCRISFPKLLGAMFLALLLIAAVLFGMMSGTFRWAGLAEILAVNVCGLPYGTGVCVYGLLLAGAYTSALLSLRRKVSVTARLLTIAAFALSGYLFPGGEWVGLLFTSVIFGVVLFMLRGVFGLRVMRCMVWCGLMTLVGGSVYLLIPVRGAAAPPVNTGDPSDIFAFESYVLREQYGKHPLLKGPTPESRRIKKETYDSVSGTYSYNVSAVREKGAEYVRLRGGNPSVRYTGLPLSHSDSVTNDSLLRGGKGYVVRDYRHEFINTPELDAWFSRLFSPDPSDRSSYADWAGLTDSTMVKVRVTEAIDKDGNFVNRVDNSTGKRGELTLLKPTPAHHWRYFLGYQVGYMYFRYLMWNFCGRQNDVHSQGQADNGNFITGIPFIDSAMLGDQDKLPPELGKENPGHREFYLIPLLSGILGAVWLAASGRRGRRADTFILVLFIMTGLAIVVYLNQTPSEPRERDYSFVGSFYAFAFWIACAAFPLAAFFRRCRLSKIKAAWISSLLLLGLSAWIFAENLPDHDRSGRTAAREFAIASLESLPENAILITNGDNYTFPLWYAQEVEGIRTDVRIINTAYLSTPWYAASLLAPTKGASAVPMTARYDDIAYGAFTFTRLRASSDTADAVTALKKLYKARSGTPALQYDVLLIPAPDGSQIALNLRSLAGGSTTLRSQKLMLLDIIATNAASGWRRPVYFLPLLSESDLGPFRNNTVREAHFLRLLPSGLPVPKDSMDVDKVYDVFMRSTLWGGMDRPGVYADRITAEQAAYMRRTMTKCAVLLEKRGREGDCTKALFLADKALTSVLPSNVPFSATNTGFVSFNDGVELGALYCRLADSLSRPELRRRGLALIAGEIERGADYFKYRRSLPPRLRAALSINTRVRSIGFYGAINAWLKSGGSRSRLLAMPCLKGIDLEKEREAFLRNEALFAVLRHTRTVQALSQLTPSEYALRPLSERQADTVLWSLREEYFRLGGTQRILDSYKEALGTDWDRAARLAGGDPAS